ncbi:PorP/SprF family type IX secretion system membrane protein [Tenacibaculum haliotis]|uniref:PorP/SprF family type IX secretion system membrane protein n=1 Tax=Tenacibaculum haliotis TaxID=1888914 RepID=UPI0021AFBFD6|nr:type IX secretion system membrane protein PorP/SprF [Tenacibaculum haliotis]MCT4699034.1 type IX secretion system membrane protein PorP/SprF [Tenacibaculum haliotis]
MKNIFLTLVLIITSVFCTDGFAQQDAQYTQYMYNTIGINPAYAGQRGALSILALHRSQWVGLDGAPKTQTLSVHSPIGVSQQLGLGLSIINDKIGPTQETTISADFSYTIPVSENGNLSFGLKGTAHLLNVDYNKLNIYNPGDNLLNENINEFSPNVGLGLYYRHADTWYLGFSVPSLLETDHLDNQSLSTSKERMNFYLTGGYVFNLSENTKFKPAFLTKAVSGAPLQVDLSANFMLHEKFILGTAYRWSAAFSGMLGFQVNDQFLVGFAYDRETTELGNAQFNDGSFELFLRFELQKIGKIFSPRFL